MRKLTYFITLTLLTGLHQVYAIEGILTASDFAPCEEMAKIGALMKLEKKAKDICEDKNPVRISYNTISSGSGTCYTADHSAKAVAIGTFYCEKMNIKIGSMNCYDKCMEFNGEFSTCHSYCGLW